MGDVSKDKLRKEITAILKNADLNKMSAKKVRQQLEEKLEVDLTDQKKMVDDLVMEFLEDSKSAGKKKKKAESEEDEDGEEENGGAEDEDEDEDDDEEEEKSKRKATKRSAPKNNRASDSEEPSDDDDEEEYGAKKKAKTSGKRGGGKKKKKGSDNDSDEDWGKSKRKSGGGAKKGGGGKAKGGYTKPCKLSPELAELLGKDCMPRHEVVKKVWAIVKERDLFDPENKQYAICDDDLFKVFGVKKFRTFGMMKYLKNHFQ